MVGNHSKQRAVLCFSFSYCDFALLCFYFVVVNVLFIFFLDVAIVIILVFFCYSVYLFNLVQALLSFV